MGFLSGPHQTYDSKHSCSALSVQIFMICCCGLLSSGDGRHDHLTQICRDSPWEIRNKMEVLHLCSYGEVIIHAGVRLFGEVTDLELPTVL